MLPDPMPGQSDSETLRTVCVLGFHRSGTSMTARVLNMLGVDLGPEEELLQPEAADNPRGYWEPRWIVDANDEILARFGAHWWTTFPAAAGWEADPALEPLLERIRQRFDASFGASPLRGWKDPRTSLTLPFWRHVAGDQVFVICLRNPIDAIASLQRRPEPSLSTAAWSDLWLEYIARALDNTKADRRLVVFYEDLLRDAREEVARLARFIGRPLEDDDARWERVIPTIDPALRHHATSPLELAGLEALSAPARMAFLALRSARDLRRTSASAGSDSAIADVLERVVPDLWWSRVCATRAEQLADERLQALDLAEHKLEAALNEARLGAEKADRLKETARELADVNRALEVLYASRSWRLTAPLRALKRRASCG
jgi:hypothetical protein